MPFGAQVLAACIFTGMVVYITAPSLQTAMTGSTQMSDNIRATEQSRYFRNCNEARAAGVAPISRGSPGYRPELDGDHDGEACEPIPY